MFKIFKYIFDTKEWDEIRNSKLKSEEREKLFNEYILYEKNSFVILFLSNIQQANTSEPNTLLLG